MKKVTACLTAVALAGTVAATAATMAGCGSSDLRILLLANNAEDAFYKQYFAELEEECVRTRFCSSETICRASKTT